MTVVSVDFRSSLKPGQEAPAKVASQHIGRTLGHLDHVDVGAIVTAYLATYDQELDPARLVDFEDGFFAMEVLRITTLVESVLDEARKTMRVRMALDVASNLLPLLTQKENGSVDR